MTKMTTMPFNSEPGKQLDLLISAAYTLREKRREVALRESLNAAKKRKNV